MKVSQEREREVDAVAVSAAEALAEEKKEKVWRNRGKGNGNRWLMLRDLLAILSLRPMSTMLAQDTMFLHKGLKRQTVRNMLEQLERTRSIRQVEDATGPIHQWVWVATEGGVHFWIGSRKAIPASIARVAWTMKPVNKYEEVTSID